jgi:hypothetical protein
MLPLMIYTDSMSKLLAALIAFIPAILIGWLLDAWLPALTAGAVAFLLLWPLVALVQTGIDRLIRWASTSLTLPRNP